MRRSVKLLASAAVLVVCFLGPSRPVEGQTVTNVRAEQLTDGTERVRVRYDLTGAAAGGATVSVAFSSDGGATWGFAPSTSALSGNVGAGVANGTNRQILWNIAGLAPGTQGTSWKARVTATNPIVEGDEITYTLPGGVPLVMVRIPSGTFQMGSPATERSRSSDEVLHNVTLTEDYYTGKYEVTQAQWQAVMGTAMSTACGSVGIGASYPVYCVKWNDIRGTGGFLEKLNAYLTSTGQPGAGKFRLPTEAEWERSARGGTQTRFSFGDALFGDYGGDNCSANAEADPYIWWCGNAGSTTHAVGTKNANPYGLHDMHGNVYEWVEDWYGIYPSTAQTNPTGPLTGSYRVFRGGCWDCLLYQLRSAKRLYSSPANGSPFTGFRLSRSQ